MNEHIFTVCFHSVADEEGLILLEYVESDGTVPSLILVLLLSLLEF